MLLQQRKGFDEEFARKVITKMFQLKKNSGTVSNNGGEIRGINENSNASNRSMTPRDKISVIKELSRLMKLGGESIGNTVMLRKVLSPFLGIFREVRKNDAGDA